MAGRYGRREPASFSLSFLDVIACATGIIIFLTIMMLIVTERSVPQELRERYDRARSEAAAQERIVAEARENEELTKQMAALETALTQLTARRDEARSKAARLRERAALKAKIAELESALGQAQAQASVEELLRRRSPFLRESAKRENVWFFFHKPGYVRIIERTGGQFFSRHFRLASGGLSEFDDMIFVPISNGIQVDELIRTGGISDQKFQSFDRTREYVGCYVAPVQGCHDDFVRVREVLYQAQIEVGFRFELNHEMVIFGTSGRQAPVQ